MPTIGAATPAAQEYPMYGAIAMNPIPSRIEAIDPNVPNASINENAPVGSVLVRGSCPTYAYEFQWVCPKLCVSGVA